MTTLMQMEEAARDLGRRLKRDMPPGVGYALLLFHFGEGGSMTYVSSAQRADMILALEEMLVRLKTGGVAPHGAPNHPANKPGKG